jgi:hypothetical protein
MEIVCALQMYLADWPMLRVRKLQALIGGWAPFDSKQQPLPIANPEDVVTIGRGIVAQRRAFEAIGMPIPRDLFEIDALFMIANEVLQEPKPEAERSEQPVFVAAGLI